jgi:hypothetical protein
LIFLRRNETPRVDLGQNMGAVCPITPGTKTTGFFNVDLD